jgi:SAM-dependent methyltransferase
MILDAACGSGGFLLEAFKYLEKQGDTNHEQQASLENSFWGYKQDINPLKLAKIIHESNLPNLYEKKLPDSAPMQFDVVMSSPPWRTTHFQPIDTVHEVRNLLDCLKPGGRLGILLPPNAFDIAVRELCKANAFIIHEEVKTFDFHGKRVENLLLVLKKFTPEEAYYFFQRESQKILSDFRTTQSAASTHCLLPIDDYHELIFKLLCYERRGIEFQDWFANIMKKYDSTFKPVKS